MIKTSETILKDLSLNEIMEWFEIKIPNASDYLSLRRSSITDFLSNDVEELQQRQKTIGILIENGELCAALYQILDLRAQVQQLNLKLYGHEDRASIANYTDAIRQTQRLMLHVDKLLQQTGESELFQRIKKGLETLLQSDTFGRIATWSETYVMEDFQPKSMRILLYIDELFSVKEVQIKDFSQGHYENTLAGCIYSQTKEKALERLNIFTSKGDQLVNMLFTGHLQDPYGDTTILSDAIDQNMVRFKQDTYLLLKSCFSFLDKEADNIIFHLKCVEFCKNAKKLGTSCCFPSLYATDSKRFEVHESYSFSLAQRLKKKGCDLDTALIQNPIRFDHCNSALVVTGANQGGKTTYLETIGMIQFLAQLGVVVPARQAQISPVDAIFTIFAGQEKESGHSQLSSEFDGVLRMLSNVSEHSLVLCNELFTLTDTEDGVFFSQEVLYVLMTVGAKSVWVTHLFPLAVPLAPGDPITSLVMTVEGERHHPVYKIKNSPPDYKSYAFESIHSYQSKS